MRFNFIFFVLLSTAFAFGRGGGQEGGGGDLPSPETDSAWYMGHDKVVRYCIYRDEKFPLPLEVIREQFGSASATWRKYLNPLYSPNNSMNMLPTLPSRVFDETGVCDGTEDLRIFIGVLNAETLELKKHFNNPVAFAYRTQFDKKTGWGKGVLWIAPQAYIDPKMTYPDWTNPVRLHGMFLHELGHIFGCGHTEGTIMTERIAHLLTMGFPMIQSAYMTHIDQNKELMPCGTNKPSGENCIYPGELGIVSPGFPIQEEEKRNFKLLVGKDGGQDIITNLIFKGTSGKPVLEIKDWLRIYEFPIEVDYWRSVYTDLSSKIFKFYPAQINMIRMAEVLFGTITTQTGNKLEVKIEKNVSTYTSGTIWGPVIIKARLASGEEMGIFASDWMRRPPARELK